MEAKAVARQVRVSPIKVRRVLALIQGKKVGDALVALRFSPQKSAQTRR
jgi:Ribosomal protein L22